MSFLHAFHTASPVVRLTRKQRPRLSSAIFSRFVVFVLGMILVVSLVLAAIFHWSFERDTEQSLLMEANALAEQLEQQSDEQRITFLSQQVAGGVRITLINVDGSVLFDSVANTDVMDNHASRPEVIGAGEDGNAIAIRGSSTLGENVVYAAASLDDGDVVRVSQLQETLLAMLINAGAPLLFTICMVMLLTMLFSQKLAQNIVRPLDEIDWSDTCDDVLIYEEMEPMALRINRQRKQLELQNKQLAEISTIRRDFSANVSHEMKTPLQVISGYAELMKNGLVDGPDVVRFSGLIYDEAQVMRTLIDDVLTLSLLDERAMDPSAGKDSWVDVDLLQLSKRVQSRLDSFARDYEVQVITQGEPTIIKAHEMLVEQAIFNLAENAVRYNRPDGSVVIRVFTDEYEDEILMRQCTVEDLLLGEHVRREAVVLVEDTGQGIPEDQQERVFERFYRLEQSRSKETGGTGLGLAIVKHTVEYHGGAIQLRSAIGKGSVFEMRFPLKR